MQSALRIAGNILEGGKRRKNTARSSPADTFDIEECEEERNAIRIVGTFLHLFQNVLERLPKIVNIFDKVRIRTNHPAPW